ncbi:hypothetical protein LWI29_037213 [Acer saccharum]|uniref:Reverse transcriptase domain-containing protein n=1 Tax=Acer saccharum TaxID=4024 RepID=A0AA39W0B2_ACESA|nr:hypothetical protein LWI29_037213 [Acer saccharum]
MVLNHRAMVLFLQETKLKSFDSRTVCSLGGSILNKGIGVAAIGLSGGLLSLWDDNFFEVTDCISNNHSIMIVDAAERKGVSLDLGAIRSFNSFLLQANVVDMPMQAMEFTWTNSRDVAAWSRLDRFLISPSLLLNFSNLKQTGLPRTLSDHNPILLTERKVDWGPRPFRFVNVWLEDLGMMKDVMDGWVNCNQGSLAAKLKDSKKRMKMWIARNKENRNSWKISKARLVEIDKEAAMVGWIERLRNERLSLLATVWEGLRKKYQVWRQKSRVKWVKQGDKNSRFFHLVADGRNSRNFIGDLRIDGEVVTDPIKIKEGVFNFFSSHFQNVIGKDRSSLGLISRSYRNLILEGWNYKWKNDKEGGIVIKLDFEKAYNSVDHGFVDASLESMGFGLTWRRWIKDCISSPRMSVLVNGSSTSQFSVNKGLRQGDPLSPFLFNVVAEGLNCMLHKATTLDLIRGEDFGGSRIHVSHLHFADDTIIFVKPKVEYLRNVKRILRCFDLVSGLKINFSKPCVVRIGKKAIQEPIWAETLFCKSAVLLIVYLGLPLGSRPWSKSFSNPVIDRVHSRLAPWYRKFLSKSGRVVLIKSVLSSIPMYYMSIFKMPVSVANKIERIQRSFLWGDEAVKRKVHAVNWDTVCKSKLHGGLGIGRMAVKNKALIAKWVWRFSKEDSSLWRRVIIARYGLDENCLLWKGSTVKGASHFVKAVASLFTMGSRSKNILKDGVKAVIGDGSRIKFWDDPWADEATLKSLSQKFLHLPLIRRGLWGTLVVGVAQNGFGKSLFVEGCLIGSKINGFVSIQSFILWLFVTRLGTLWFGFLTLKASFLSAPFVRCGMLGR